MIVLWCKGSFRRALNWAYMMPRDANLSDSYTSDCCHFCSLDCGIWCSYEPLFNELRCNSIKYDRYDKFFLELNGVLFDPIAIRKLFLSEMMFHAQNLYAFEIFYFLWIRKLVFFHAQKIAWNEIFVFSPGWFAKNKIFWKWLYWQS